MIDRNYSKVLSQSSQLCYWINVDKKWSWAKNAENLGVLKSAVEHMKEEASNPAISSIMCCADSQLKKNNQEAELTSLLENFLKTMKTPIDQCSEVYDKIMKRGQV